MSNNTIADTPIDFTADVLDSRDLIARIEYLEALDPEMEAEEIADNAAELAILKELEEEAANYISDWQYGETFINENYFEDYAEELAEEIGAISREASWPLNRIDWAAAADDLKIDYTEFTVDGNTFWARG